MVKQGFSAPIWGCGYGDIPAGSVHADGSSLILRTGAVLRGVQVMQQVRRAPARTDGEEEQELALVSSSGRHPRGPKVGSRGPNKREALAAARRAEAAKKKEV